MSEKVTVHEKLPAWMKRVNWALAVAFLVAVLQGFGVPVSGLVELFPEGWLPVISGLLLVLATVLAKVLKLVYFKWFNKARVIEMKDDGTGTFVAS